MACNGPQPALKARRLCSGGSRPPYEAGETIPTTSRFMRRAARRWPSSSHPQASAGSTISARAEFADRRRSVMAAVM